MTYSEKVYNISIAIGIDANNKLTSQIILDGKAVKSLSVAFENIYEGATAPSGPQTGDNNDLMMWVTLLIVSGSVLAVLISKYRKNS